jgi:hypothetical protein
MQRAPGGSCDVNADVYLVAALCWMAIDPVISLDREQVRYMFATTTSQSPSVTACGSAAPATSMV